MLTNLNLFNHIVEKREFKTDPAGFEPAIYGLEGRRSIHAKPRAPVFAGYCGFMKLVVYKSVLMINTLKANKGCVS